MQKSAVGDSEIVTFLTHLATDVNVTASTQNQARNAVVFFYTNVLKRAVGELGGIVQGKPSDWQATVLRADEIELILNGLVGIHKLMASLIYSCGMRISEVVRLDIQDLDFDGDFITVRDPKYQKSRLVPLP